MNVCRYCSPHLLVKAYRDTYTVNIYPVPDSKSWVNVSLVQFSLYAFVCYQLCVFVYELKLCIFQLTEGVKCPPSLRLLGRPKKNRYHAIDEEDEAAAKKARKKCEKYSLLGHNTRTCKGAPSTIASSSRGARGGTIHKRWGYAQRVRDAANANEGGVGSGRGMTSTNANPSASGASRGRERGRAVTGPIVGDVGILKCHYIYQDYHQA